MRVSTGPILLIIFAALLIAGAVFWIANPSSDLFTFGEGTRAGAGDSVAERELARANPTKNAAPKDLHIPPPAELVAKGGTLHGRVRFEPADAGAPKGLALMLRPSRFVAGKETAESRDLSVDAKQNFLAERLKFGAYELRATAPGWSGVPSEVSLTRDMPYADLQIRIFKNPDVTGYVRDFTRLPIEGIRVTLAGRDELGSTVYEEAYSAADGGFLFKSVPDGEFTIAAGSPGNPLRTPLSISVREGRAPSVAIDVPTPATLQCDLFVPGYNVPVEGVFVTIFRAGADGGATENAISPANGKVIFKNLPAGKYIIRASREYFRPVNTFVMLEEGKTESAYLKMMPLLDELLVQFSFAAPPEPAPEFPVPPMGPPAPEEAVTSKPPK